ncbi:response regulator, partial [Vibrio sp. D173a]|nr:response regulator [Vibrio sp. D173a]
HSIWDSTGKRALILWCDSSNLTEKELQLWRPEAAWQRLSHSEKSYALSKPLLKLCHSLQLIQLNQPDSARAHIDSSCSNEFSENDIEAFFLMALCYQSLGVQEKVEQITRQLDTLLKTDSSGLALLQRIALQQADNFALPPLNKSAPATVS